MPVPTHVPSLFVPINSLVLLSKTIPNQRPEQLYQIALPPPAPHTRRSVSHNLEQQNKLMREQLESAGKLLDANFAHMWLMEAENARLRNKVFAKRTKKRIAVNTGRSRHLTGEENMHELLKYEMKQVLEGLKPKFRTIRKEIKKAEQAEVQANKAAEKVRKAAERALQKEAKVAQQRALGRGRGRTRGRGGGHTRSNVGRGRGLRVQQEDDHETETEGSDFESELSSSDNNTPDSGTVSENDQQNPILDLSSNPSLCLSSPYPPQAQSTFVVEADKGTGSSKDLAEDSRVNSEGLEGEGDEGLVEGADIENIEEMEEETKIRRITGHKWIGRGLRLLVEWDDDDITWEPFSNVENCLAVDIYLEHHAVADQSELPRKMYRFE
ncbi:hypothetical protein F5876DRAFT_71065 [Lentinula aff. lateritia]|uniref:Uncharacterized protein n=1 Tax=Lentinula aff. lateritia TaxID=2804960 RepID=A0ACC1TGM1_9AGAR|nr:hypothetical protein F5876DRAFT_71065 [Lentinula aff. lateritia]